MKKEIKNYIQKIKDLTKSGELRWSAVGDFRYETEYNENVLTVSAFKFEINKVYVDDGQKLYKKVDHMYWILKDEERENKILEMIKNDI
jgi:hypothetical protein